MLSFSNPRVPFEVSSHQLRGASLTGVPLTWRAGRQMSAATYSTNSKARGLCTQHARSTHENSFHEATASWVQLSGSQVGGDFVPHSSFGNVRRHFSCHNSGALLASRGQGCCSTPHNAQNSPPKTKNELAQNDTGTQFEKPWPCSE